MAFGGGGVKRAVSVLSMLGLLVGVLAFGTPAAAAQAPDPGKPPGKNVTEATERPVVRAPAQKPARPDVRPGQSTRDVTVKFREGSSVRLRGGRLVTTAGDDTTAVIATLARYPGTTVSRLFDRPEQALEEEKARLESRSSRQQADKNLYYSLRLPEGTDTNALLAELNQLEIIEVAYARALPVAPPVTPDFEGNQGYRQPAPGGVDAVYAASQPGGRGENVRIVDIEYSWNTNHEDLSKARLPGALIPNGTLCDPFNDNNHGTAVLGELIADANGFGVTGIASGASIGMVAANSCENGYNVANAIDVATAALSSGDVILLEQQTPGPGGPCDATQVGCIPVEWVQDVYDAIVAATSAGIIVVEAAGNGAQNLDDAMYGAPFPAGRADSGAIIVGAGNAPGCSSPARGRLAFSNHGARVDLQGWGQCVATTGYGGLQSGNANELYTAGFGGTSSASPFVAAAAAVVSSVAQASARTMTPQQVRALLRTTGTAQDLTGLAGNIGSLPDLRAAVPQAAGPHAVINCGSLPGILARNDDGSTDLRALGFDVRFFGTTYSGMYVNNNGNVTFDAPSGTYVPYNLYETTHPIIAPFFTDIDTRNTATSPVAYGQITYDGRPAFCVNWLNVGEYSNGAVPNDIQLILVDRSVTGNPATLGDFDMIFNYDRVLWDHGAARAGFSNGSGGLDPGSALELNGSGVTGAFLDSNVSTGLIHNRSGLPLTDPQRGRYLFPVRNGAAPPPGGIQGTVTAANGGAAVDGAAVTACRVGGGCRPPTTTNASGQYAINSLPAGDYTVSANPTASSNLFPKQVGPVTVGTNPAPVAVNIQLNGSEPPPAGTTVGGSTGTTSGGLPVLVVGRTFSVTRTDCDGGGGTVRVFQNGVQRQFHQASVLVSAATMTESPPGTYTADALSLPFTGPAEIRIVITGCPDVDFNIYIDPSGFVRTTSGTGIVGATVTLLRSDDPTGPFTQVPDGSPVMSPSNTTNPDLTDSTGHFGWDVIAGYYKVQAARAGCVSPTNPSQSFVESHVMTIPPPVTDLLLELDCGTASLSIGDVAVTEGHSGTTTATFTITRAPATPDPASVQWSTSDGSAVAPGDYVAVPLTTVNFTPGETTKSVSVTINGDALQEANEGFTVNLSTPTGAVISDGTAVGRIMNDDIDTFSVNDVSVTEGNAGTKLATFTISRAGGRGAPASVRWSTLNAHATAGSDYVAVGLTTVNFAVGEATKSVSVTINGDTAVEPEEDFYVRLTSPVGAQIADGSGLGRITNDDAATLTVNDVTVTEGDSGTKLATFTITRAGAVGGPASVRWNTADGTGGAPGDYLAVPATTVTFAAGETSKAVSVTVKGDTAVEANETFAVRLSAPVGASVADGSGLGRITNDDTATLAVNDVTVTEGNAGPKLATFTITRSGAVAGPATVRWSTANGTATAPTDYAAVGLTTVTFAPGETTKTVSVTVNGDTALEANETFQVRLSSPTAAALVDSSGLGRITNDDSA